MRIVLIVHEFPALSESFIVNKFVGLLQKGFDVHVVCQVSTRNEIERFSQLNEWKDWHARVSTFFPVEPKWMVPVWMPFALLWILLVCPLRTVWYLRSIIGVGIKESLRRVYLDAPLIRIKPDILHFEFGTLAKDKMYLKEALGCRIVVSFRGFDISYAGLEDPTYYLETWRLADRIHFLGEDLLKLARTRGYDGPDKHVLIPPSIDHRLFEPGQSRDGAICGTPDRPLRILSVGRLTWKKGYEFALAAVSRLAERGMVVRYTIIGEGDFYEGIAFAVHQFGLTGKVTLVGKQRPEAVREKMANADILLHAAVSEGFCNAVLEAQAMCLPVVCSDATGLRENVVHDVTGFVTPRRDPEAMAFCLERLAKDPGLRDHMGRAGRERVLVHFRLEDQIGKFASMYSGIESVKTGRIEG
jgi:colanic acid/amylovoran biosynthesis glycosyltransferase